MLSLPITYAYERDRLYKKFLKAVTRVTCNTYYEKRRFSMLHFNPSCTRALPLVLFFPVRACDRTGQDGLREGGGRVQTFTPTPRYETSRTIPETLSGYLRPLPKDVTLHSPVDAASAKKPVGHSVTFRTFGWRG